MKGDNFCYDCCWLPKSGQTIKFRNRQEYVIITMQVNLVA